MYRIFQRSLERRPLLTQIVASGVICGAGDAACQYVFEKRSWKTYDAIRTGRFFVLGAFIITPVLSRWFVILERVIKGNPRIVPLKRVAADQLLFSPFFNAIILITLRMLEGIGFKDSYRQMKEDWSTIYLNSLKVWPAVQLLNFYLIPLNMRVIIVQLVAFFWNTYLSFKTQKGIDIGVDPHKILDIAASGTASNLFKADILEKLMSDYLVMQNVFD